ncbi:tRNA 2'-phosphotransferase 1-like [Brassica napus]|uniref:tRNA 2'-phosphotransferase 1-like n=1 Tax=Brassica napus TaxID=3708 RepID=UPI002078F59F|nr:tRNA 2'-phosphotransferase 1-like [Brassica napus]
MGFVKVGDLLELNLKTSANVQLKSHTVDEIRETVESDKLLKPILSPEEVPVCVHGTYKKNLESILASGLKRMNRLHVHISCGLPTDGEVISGMRRDVNVLIFLDIKKALEDGIAFYISDNKVILTEGVDGVVPVDYFQKIESWPSRQPIPF